MTIEVRLIADYELDTWDEFVSTTPGGTLYHTSTWRTVINESYGGGRYELVAAWADGEIVAGFCALIRKRIGVLTAVTPLATPYTGYLFGAAATTDAKTALIKYVTKFRYQHLQCVPVAGDFTQLETAGYKLIPRRTLEINLRLHEDELWNRFDSNVRRNIRKAQKAGLDITDQWDALECYKLMAETFERNGERCPIHEKWFQEISNGHHLEDHRRRYVAWKNGKTVAFLVALRSEGRVYYQLAGTSTDARTTGVSSLLIWELLREHLDGNWDIFDFVGGNTPSITRFKEGFNPTERPHLLIEMNRSTRINLGRSIRDLIKRRKPT